MCHSSGSGCGAGGEERLLVVSDSCPSSPPRRQSGWVLVALIAMLHPCFTNRLVPLQFYTRTIGILTVSAAGGPAPELANVSLQTAITDGPRMATERPLQAVRGNGVRC